jgi:anaerobic ribonucleoside-triphosphate reductase activating protein
MNGPGDRFGVWVQGCGILCKGCFNPKTLPYLKNQEIEFVPPTTSGWTDTGYISDLIRAEHESSALEGITVSGGEPLEQPAALKSLLNSVQDMGLTTVVFSGFTSNQIFSDPEKYEFFKKDHLVDVLISGPYLREEQIEKELRGSANQEIHLLTDRYTIDDLEMSGSMEVIVRADGSVAITGFTRPELP